jgi:integrase/recombinase XerD
MSTMPANSPKFTSALAAKLEQFLAQKHAMGYRYREEGRALRELDRFLNTRLSPEDPVVTLEMVHDYIARRGTESESNRAHRLTLMREVCRFLRLEDDRTVVPDRRSLRIVRQKFVPRVLSRDEGRFLQACTELRQGRTSPVRDTVLGTALRLLYLAGLRAGELLRLTQADVDLDAGLLHIRHTQFDKSRMVPISPDLAQQLARCRTLATKRFAAGAPEKPFFPSPRGGRYSITALRDAFHQTLKTAGIERTSGNRHIRLHELRHYAEFRTMPSKPALTPINQAVDHFEHGIVLTGSVPQNQSCWRNGRCSSNPLKVRPDGTGEAKTEASGLQPMSRNVRATVRYRHLGSLFNSRNAVGLCRAI